MNKLKLLRNIIIGSANFTQKYGADLKKINYNEVSNILNLAKKKNICKIDTVQAYLKNKKIFTNIDKKFMFFSKV